MGHYVLLMRDHSAGLKSYRQNSDNIQRVEQAVERWEAKVLHSFRLLGEWDQCLIIEAPDNFTAYHATLAQELSTTANTQILPAVDLPVFARLLKQTTETEGPHRWQVQPWARLVRLLMYDYTYSRWARKFFTHHQLSGRQHFDEIKGPCIIISNHASHYDQYCLMKAIPFRIRSNLFFGAAADRWFLKGRKEVQLRPWYQSLVNAAYPIHRGGGSRALDYPKWLLDQGANLMLFPEGTRTRGNHLSRFKHGTAILALEKNVPIVPIYMAGLKRIRPAGTREATPGPVAAHVLPPIRFSADTSVPEATEIMYRVMREAHESALADPEYEPGATQTAGR